MSSHGKQQIGAGIALEWFGKHMFDWLACITPTWLPRDTVATKTLFSHQQPYFLGQFAKRMATIEQVLNRTEISVGSPRHLRHLYAPHSSLCNLHLLCTIACSCYRESVFASCQRSWKLCVLWRQVIGQIKDHWMKMIRFVVTVAILTALCAPSNGKSALGSPRLTGFSPSLMHDQGDVREGAMSFWGIRGGAGISNSSTI